jgi:hypothetical protein
MPSPRRVLAFALLPAPAPALLAQKAVPEPRVAEVKERNTRYYKWRDALLVATNDIAVPLPVDTWKAKT